MAVDKDTRDMAIKALQKIDSHIDGCERRYREGRESLDRLMQFMKEAHAENRKDISLIKDTIAEQRGAGKMVKLIGATAAALAGGLAGFAGSKLPH